MNKEKYIKLFSIFVAAALVISLVTNFTLLSKVNNMEHTINQLSTTQHDIINNVNSQSSHVQSVLNDFKEEQSWIGPIHMNVNVEDLTDDKAEATFEWQIKELQENSDVVFHYAVGDEEDFTALPVEQTDQGLYQVSIPLEITMEPQWEVIHMQSRSHRSEESMEAEVINEKEEREKNQLRYYVTVSNDDMVKSDEIHMEQLSYFGTSKYGIIQADIDLMEENFGINLSNHGVDHTGNMVHEAYLLMYQGDRLVEEKEIEAEEGSHTPESQVRFFYLYDLEHLEDMRLVVKVIYENGETFEEEVYQAVD